MNYTAKTCIDMDIITGIIIFILYGALMFFFGMLRGLAIIKWILRN